MAVVHVKEVTNRDTSRDVNSRKRYTRTFQVLTDTTTDGAKQVLEDPLIPAYGDTWEEVDAGAVVTDTDTDAFCVEKRATQNDADNFQNWMVTCEYVGVGDPTLEPAQVSFSNDRYQETTQRDVEDEWFRNSAEDFYESGFTRDRTRLVLHLVKNVLSFDPLNALQYVDTLNELPSFVARFPPGFAAQLCKLDSLTAEAVWYPDNSDIQYWRRTAQISIDARGWEVNVLDAGFHAIVTVPVIGNARGKIIMPDGSTPSVPQPLNGTGGRLPVGGNPQYRTFIKYRAVDWTPLNLDF